MASGYWLSGRLTKPLTAFSGANPGSVLNKSRKLRISKPAPTSSTTAKDVSVTTSAERRKPSQYQGFGNELTNDAEAAGAERDSHRDLALSLRAARQQQVGNVRTR